MVCTHSSMTYSINSKCTVIGACIFLEAARYMFDTTPTDREVEKRV